MDNKKIASDLYNIDLDTHLSYSSLKCLVESIEKFIEYKTKPFEETPALRFGKLYDKYILEEDDFFNHYFVAPDMPEFEKKSKDQPLTIAEQKEAWKKEIAESNKDKISITKEELIKLQDMKRKLKLHPVASDLLFKNKDVAVQDKIEFNYKGERFIGFSDYVSHDTFDGKPYVVDLKTTTDCNINNISRSIQDYMYYIQMFFYKGYYSKKNKRDYDFYFIFQDKATHDIQVVNLDATYFDIAKKEIDLAIKRFKEFKANPQLWVGKSDTITTIAPAFWYTKRQMNQCCTNPENKVIPWKEEKKIEEQVLEGPEKVEDLKQEKNPLENSPHHSQNLPKKEIETQKHFDVSNDLYETAMKGPISKTEKTESKKKDNNLDRWNSTLTQEDIKTIDIFITKKYGDWKHEYKKGLAVFSDVKKILEKKGFYPIETINKEKIDKMIEVL